MIEHPARNMEEKGPAREKPPDWEHIWVCLCDKIEEVCIKGCGLHQGVKLLPSEQMVPVCPDDTAGWSGKSKICMCSEGWTKLRRTGNLAFLSQKIIPSSL